MERFLVSRLSLIGDIFRIIIRLRKNTYLIGLSSSSHMPSLRESRFDDFVTVGVALDKMLAVEEEVVEGLTYVDIPSFALLAVFRPTPNVGAITSDLKHLLVLQNESFIH